MIKTYKKILSFLFLFLIISNSLNTFAVKIIANVGDEIITDTNLKEVDQILCIIKNIDKKICCKNNNQIESFSFLVDLKSKKSFFRSLKIDFKDFNISEEELYKMNKIDFEFIKQCNLNQNIFTNYLIIQFLWGQYIISSMRNYQITNSEIQKYKNKYPKLQNDEKIKEQIWNQKVQEISNKLSEQIKDKIILEIK